MKKYLIILSVLALCFCIAVNVDADYFRSDFAGTWMIFENDSFNVTYSSTNPIYTQSHINGTITLDNYTNITNGSWTVVYPPDPVNNPNTYTSVYETLSQVAGMNLDTTQGAVLLWNFYATQQGSTPVLHQVYLLQMAPDKDMILYSQVTVDPSTGVGMGFWIKQDSTVSYSPPDLAGTWHYDNVDGTSGSITIDSSGNVTSGGLLTVGSLGAITGTLGTDTVTGQMNSKKNAMAFIHSRGLISPLFVKQGVTMVQGDMAAGSHRFFSLFGNSTNGSPAGVSFGYVTLDSSGNVTDCNYADYRPDGTSTTSTTCKNWNMKFLFNSTGQVSGGFTRSDNQNVYTVQDGQVNSLKDFVSMVMSVSANSQATTPLFYDRSYWVNIPTQQPASSSTPTPSGGGGGGGCFIATAAYGSYLHPNVRVLRDFRDHWLLTNTLGKSLVNFYYRHSPSMADYIRQHESCRVAACLLLTPLVYAVQYPSLAALGFIFAIGLVIAKRRRNRVS